MPIDRREFLKYSAGASGMLLPSALQAANRKSDNSPATAGDAPQLRVLMVEADGSPLDKDRAATLCARDLPNDPLPRKIAHASGRARIELTSEPIQLSVRLKVPAFGEVYCWADNGGQRYTKPGNVEFVVDAAATRLRRVREAEAQAKQEGATIDAKTQTYIDDAARPVTDNRSAYAALSAGLYAGEQLAIARARNRISRFSTPRRDFYFGCLISALPQSTPEVERLVRDRFNFGTASWYTWGNEQPAEQRINYARMDASLDWCWSRSITPKGFGYCYMTRGATPEWIRSWPYEKILPEYERVVTETMRRYSGKLKYAEIINEAHDKSNLWRLSHEQILDITRAVCAAAGNGSPTVKRQINNCCLWAEYARSANADRLRRWSPYRYLADCVATGSEFEVIGLQLYYPQVDLLEIERMLDRFRAFNKPLHITEIATASADGLDPASMRPKTAAPGWHGPWSETTQADWLEAIYTLVYSKPEFEAIGWWDLSDMPGHFWPHGGLLHADLTPKLAYQRLGELQKSWGVALHS
ncbi:MAG TPA: endo-1,4-beta-xylanase [Lacipirellulaceae bacterium]|nr:endo-1,4-beta-xylanase [Lacipirellulaceae bacterium]